MSSTLALLSTLYELRIIPRGEFSWVEIRHDPGCPALLSQSNLDCRCDCEVVLRGKTYLYSDFFGSRGREC